MKRMEVRVDVQALAAFEEVLSDLHGVIYTHRHQLNPEDYAGYVEVLRDRYPATRRAVRAVTEVWEWVEWMDIYINHLDTQIDKWVDTAPYYEEYKRRDRILHQWFGPTFGLHRVRDIRSRVHRLKLAISGTPELLNQFDALAQTPEAVSEEAVHELEAQVGWVMTDYSATAQELLKIRDFIVKMTSEHPEVLRLPPEVPFDNEGMVYEAIKRGDHDELERLLTTDNAPEVLKAAIYSNNLWLTELVLQRYPEINVVPALNAALTYSSDEIIRTLLDRGRTFVGKVHIDQLVEDGNLDLIAELYRRDLVAEDKYNMLLAHSVVSEYPGTTLWLLENYPEPINEEAIQKVFDTAVGEEKFELAEVLIDRYHARCGPSTMNYAIRFYKPTVVRWLYQHCQELFTRDNILNAINKAIGSRTLQVNYEPAEIERLINSIRRGEFPEQLPFGQPQCVLL